MAKQPEQAKTTEIDPIQLATAVRNISASLIKLRESGLNKNAIIVLVHDDTGLPKKQINRVLDSLSTLAEKYTSK